ncbi:MAG TPA: AbrB/MazE/SpoVT family DNA-binding domain-containing protein [Candidatus Nanoarchaeia archaeon]
MRQKIFRVGNSAAVLVPKKILEEKGLKVGEEAEIDVRPIFEADSEIHELTKRIIKNYRPALEELAKR